MSHEGYTPSEEEIKNAEEGMTPRQSIDSSSREVAVKHWENRSTPEELQTEFQALVEQLNSFSGKINDRSLREQKQERFKNDAGVDPKESQEYYEQLKQFRKKFVQQLNMKKQDTELLDAMDTTPGH